MTFGLPKKAKSQKTECFFDFWPTPKVQISKNSVWGSDGQGAPPSQHTRATTVPSPGVLSTRTRREEIRKDACHAEHVQLLFVFSEHVKPNSEIGRIEKRRALVWICPAQAMLNHAKERCCVLEKMKLTSAPIVATAEARPLARSVCGRNALPRTNFAQERRFAIEIHH